MKITIVNLPSLAGCYVNNEFMKDEILVSKDLLRNLAQHTADTSAMFMPMSGFAMIGASMLADQAGKVLGEEIKPTEKAFLGTVRMVETIRSVYTEELDQLRKENEEMRMKIAMMPIEID